MKYAEISNKSIVQIIETNSLLPTHKLRPNLRPVVDVRPTFDSKTQTLGPELLVVEPERVVRTWEVIQLPPATPDSDERIALLEKRNAALEAALAEKGLITKSDVDVKLAAELDASGLRLR